MELVDFSTLFFLVLAVVIAFQLRSVLGKRTGNERPPRDVFRDRPEQRDDNVVSLPQREGQPAPDTGETSSEEDRKVRLGQVDRVAKPETPAHEGLTRIVAADPQFEPVRFMEGARSAHEMIVQAFAAGDRGTLRMLLAPEVMADFESAIAEREKAGQTVESTYVGVEKTEVRDARIENDEAQITIRFVSQMISATKDRNGTVVEGDPEQVTEGADIWTFARDIRSSDPNWLLVATGEA